LPGQRELQHPIPWTLSRTTPKSTMAPPRSPPQTITTARGARLCPWLAGLRPLPRICRGRGRFQLRSCIGESERRRDIGAGPYPHNSHQPWRSSTRGSRCRKALGQGKIRAGNHRSVSISDSSIPTASISIGRGFSACST
jgi:hypothetical protein